MGGTILGMIGLARRAGKIESGRDAVRRSVGRGEARLIVLAGDAAPRTRKGFEQLAGDTGIPVIVFGTRDSLGTVMGKQSRSVVAVTDENFARGIIRMMERGEKIEN